MKVPMIGLAALACLMAAPVFAQSWSGYLVDAKCYDSEERSVDPFGTAPPVSRDKNLEIGMCTPSFKTRSFAVVQPDELRSFYLDAAGNAKAAGLVERTGKRSFHKVTVTGEMFVDVIEVKSISNAR
jgi:hypothetical protein